MTRRDHTITQLLQHSQVHAQWQPLLSRALQTLDADYLATLLEDESWLPGRDKLLRAFTRDVDQCRFILFGESPYPRATSANGIAFYDAAVKQLWSANGLGKAVNKATSLRNLMKTALLAEGLITPDANGKITQPMIAAVDKSNLIQHIDELFQALQARGFLLFNATPVLHPQRKPAAEMRYWHPFVESLLQQIAERPGKSPTLILWGKIAQQILAIPAAQQFDQLISEHPYNISFIHNPAMQQLFADLRLLQKNTRKQSVYQGER